MHLNASDKHIRTPDFDLIGFALFTQWNLFPKPAIGISTAAPDPAEQQIIITEPLCFEVNRTQWFQRLHTADCLYSVEKIVRERFTGRSNALVEFQPDFRCLQTYALNAPIQQDEGRTRRLFIEASGFCAKLPAQKTV